MGKRNPNGYGCVTKLSGSRSKPWVVKVTIYDGEGRTKQTPIGYAKTEKEANILLAQYNDNPWDVGRDKITLSILYKRWSEMKLPKLGIALQCSLRSAYKHCSKYYGMRYRNIRAFHMQESIDNCGCEYATQGAIKNLWGHLDRFAYEQDIIEKMYSQIITAPPIPETERTVFTNAQIDALWDIQEVEWVDTVLVFLYTGFRLNELLGMKTEQVFLNEKYLKGGSKTVAGKDRIVPIHPRIEPIIQKWVDQDNEYLINYKGKKMATKTYYLFWEKVMQQIGTKKTPHEARHTFETCLDNANANRKCIDLLMGHKSKDIGNRIYNHKTIDQLRETILLLK